MSSTTSTSTNHEWPTPSSQPPTSEPTVQRPLKLRASCDACASAKVKCGKEHPRCARCLSNGNTCIYGLSRKHGKPGRQRRRKPDTEVSTRRIARGMSSSLGQDQYLVSNLALKDLLQDVEHGVWNPSSVNMATDDHLGNSVFSFMDDSAMVMPNHSNPGRLQSINTDTSSVKHHFKDPFKHSVTKRDQARSDMPISPASIEFQKFESFVDTDTMNPMDTSLFPDSTQAHADNYFSERSPSRESTESTHSCYNLAYSTLESLHFRSISSSSSTSGSASPVSSPFPSFLELPTRPGQTLDSVLRSNKTAIRNVLKLLECPCARDPHLAMLYASITSKILIWYQIAGGVQRMPSPSQSSDASLCPGTPSAVTLMPITIGAFSLDEDDQEALRRQLLLNELRKAGQLIDAIASWQSEDCEDVDDVYRAMGAWLKSELFKTIREIKNT
ncbi:hypothetical protein K432DRAFT_446932 [Lepidopterella palustris CBS 459.81]|uniref:Zn(2)-C6 fungal-type domain-containing protein n=1 Tax=Lepidopterella palustris CBS 459.81 TaxID=1314670 RepID=A0A8E2E0J2_9PEZI|nr:hypothetical protein K432DRAFT_446932 [Lepidopterella palustris CBS 459.81]